MSKSRYVEPVLKRNREKMEWDDSVDLFADTTMLRDGRPVRYEAWAEMGYTFITYYMSIVDLEAYTKDEVIAYLIEQGIEITDEAAGKSEIMRFTDNNGKECWSLTVTVRESDD